MKIYATSASKFSGFGAQKLSKKITDLQKDIVVVFATGNTMVETLNSLSRDTEINWKRIQAFHLDEYKALSPNNIHSSAYYLKKNIFDKVPIPAKNIHYINGEKPDFKGYIEKLKKLGGADIVILGIGMNGHLAYNEPPCDFDSKMREIELDRSTISANKSKYPGVVDNPYAITLGMADIFKGKYLFLFANGRKKAKIIKKALQGPVTKQVPASILQKHAEVTTILDKPAASLLKLGFKEQIDDFFETKKDCLLISDIKSSKTVNAHQLFSNKKIIVLETEKGEADFFASNTITALRNKKLANSIKNIYTKNKAALQELNKNNPNIVIAPNRDKQAQALLQNYADLTGEVNTLFYETLNSPSETNLSVGFNKSDQAIILEAVRAHKTQVRRTPFDEISELMSRFASLYAKIKGFKTDKEEYANNFIAPGQKFGTIKISNTPLIVVSPHPDDPEIAAGGLLRKALKQGVTVYNEIFGTGEWGVKLTKKEKEQHKDARAIRRAEAKKAAQILQKHTRGKIVVNNLDLKSCSQDLSLNKIEKSDYQFIQDLKNVDKRFEEIFNKHKRIFEKSGQFTAVLPHPCDHHPHHRITSKLALLSLQDVAEKHKIKFTILYYIAPWSGNFNIYFHSKKNIKKDISLETETATSYKQLLSRITGELCGKFGIKSPTPEKMGGEFAERFKRVVTIRKKPAFVALSIGGEKIVSGIVDSYKKEIIAVTDELLYKEKFAKDGPNPEEMVDVISEKIKEVIKKSHINIDDISHIGISYADPIDPETGVVGVGLKKGQEHVALVNYPLADTLVNKLRKLYKRTFEVKVVNDLVAASLGELKIQKSVLHKYGYGFVFNVGAGINGLAIEEETIFEGKNGELCELGKNLLGKKAGDGKYHYRFTRHKTHGAKPELKEEKTIEERVAGEALKERGTKEGFVNISQVTKKALKGDKKARKFIKDVGEEIGSALAAFIRHYPLSQYNFPKHVALVGGVCEKLGKDVDKNDLFVSAIRNGLKEELIKFGWKEKDVKVVSSGIERSQLDFTRELIGLGY